MMTPANLRLVLLILWAVVCAGCGTASQRISHDAEDAAAPAPEMHSMPEAWVLRLKAGSAGMLQAEVRQPPPHGCEALVLLVGDTNVWVVALDSTGAAAGAWGPFVPGHVAGGYGSPALVLGGTMAAQQARSAGARTLQLVRVDVESGARAQLSVPPAGDFVVVESGPTRILSRSSGRTRVLLNYRLASIGFSPAASRWAGIRGDEYALNRVVILDNGGQVLHESIVTKATYDAARVFGAGRWVDWIGTSPRGELVRVVADFAGPSVRTAPVPSGWGHRSASPNGLYVMARDGGRLTLYRDTQPDLNPAVVWVRDEAAPIQDESVRDDGMVAYHVLQRQVHGDPALRLVCVAPDGRERALPPVAPEEPEGRPGLRFAGRWLIEGLRAPLEPATGRTVVLYDLQT